jgi:hypothetical protein
MDSRRSAGVVGVRDCSLEYKEERMRSYMATRAAEEARAKIDVVEERINTALCLYLQKQLSERSN